MPFNLPALPYAYDALEPHIDARTMEIHHTKHHQAYTDKFNQAISSHQNFNNQSAENIITNLGTVPEDIRAAVRNHGGGYVNHTLFWQIMSPDGGGQPTGSLLQTLNQTFGSFKDFQEKFTHAAISQFGSGWGWLILNSNQELEIITTSNQDSPLTLGATPLLTVDVWEHAYYLKYQNKRPDYLDAFWHVVNWPQVSQIFDQHN
jgi:superoxide dismutase, Fe-Mn family